MLGRTIQEIQALRLIMRRCHSSSYRGVAQIEVEELGVGEHRQVIIQIEAFLLL